MPFFTTHSAARREESDTVNSSEPCHVSTANNSGPNRWASALASAPVSATSKPASTKSTTIRPQIPSINALAQKTVWQHLPSRAGIVRLALPNVVVTE